MIASGYSPKDGEGAISLPSLQRRSVKLSLRLRSLKSEDARSAGGEADSADQQAISGRRKPGGGSAQDAEKSRKIAQDFAGGMFNDILRIDFHSAPLRTSRLSTRATTGSGLTHSLSPLYRFNRK